MSTYEQADALLDVLGGAPVGTPGALFREARAKEWMESNVIRAVKKLQAADYHCANIDAEIQDLHKMAEEAARKGCPSFVRLGKDSIAFELDAFLAAARSCIDLISGMLALHFSGMNRRTDFRRVLAVVSADSAAPFGSLLRQWQNWIEQVKKYRDECVHYRTIYMTGGYRVEAQGENVVARVLPVLVPERVIRQDDEPTLRTDRNLPFVEDIHEFVGIAGVPPYPGPPLDSDTYKKFVENLSKFTAGRRSYVPVEDFCRQHLEKLHQFVSDAFHEVVVLGFRSSIGVKHRRRSERGKDS